MGPILPHPHAISDTDILITKTDDDDDDVVVVDNLVYFLSDATWLSTTFFREKKHFLKITLFTHVHILHEFTKDDFPKK